MSFKQWKKHMAALAMVIIVFGGILSPGWGGTATISSSASQTIKGWGCFPSRGDTESDDQGALWALPAMQDVIYNAGFTVMRTVLLPGLYVSGGSTAGNVVLNQSYVTKLTHNIQMAQSHGVNTWTLHPWSPPPSMKCNGNTQNGHLNTASEQTYCNFYTAALLAVKNQGLPLPSCVSLQNEPHLDTACGGNSTWDTSSFTDVAQYIRVVKALRSTLDANGLQSVKIFGPESSSYFESVTTLYGGSNWLGGNTFSNLSDSAFNSALAAYALHSYDTDNWQDIANGMALHPKDAYMTEWSIPGGATEMDWTINAARHMAGDLVDVPNNYWYWWDGWCNAVRAPDNEELLTGNPTPAYAKRYYFFQKLWTVVRPGWIVKKMTTNDPDLKTDGTGQTLDAHIDLMAFECATGIKSAVLLSNWTTGSKSITVNGLKGVTYSTFITDATRDMVMAANSQSITGGAAAVTLPAYSITLIVTDPAATNNRLINCGGSAIGSFADDSNYAGGLTAFTAKAINTSGVISPAPNEVYESERYGNMTYTVQGLSANGSYTVRLHFCENYFTASGQRKFNVSLNGTPALANFDVFAAAGAAHKANVQQFNATADSNGKIAIVFTSVVNNALVNGIEVTASGGTVTTDFLNDWSVVNSKSGNWELDASNPGNINGDTSRAARTVDDTEYLIYKFTGITTFNAKVYTLAGPITMVTCMASTDNGNTWQPVGLNDASKTLSAGGWGYYNIVPGSLPSGTNALKILFNSGTGNYWDPQLSQISITHG